MKTTIPIYGSDGSQEDSIDINDTLIPVNGRVSKGSKHYYKGAGVPYHGQFLSPDSRLNTYGYTIKEISDVFYMGPYVSKWVFEGKTGIFRERYQPQFSDFIGSCGVKELSIIENSMEFGRSSVEVIRSVNYDVENQQYYFVLNYKCDRVKYLDCTYPHALYTLLEYMIKEDWNFIWDKTSIQDISFNGMVSDVGDIFKSGGLGNKLGTIYSVLYSLGNLNVHKYHEFISYCGLVHDSSMSFVMNSIYLLRKFGVDVSVLLADNNNVTNFKNAVMNYLITGRNCGDCCYIELGDQIREKYIEQTKKQLLI